MRFHVFLKATIPRAGVVTEITAERFFSRVNTHMHFQSSSMRGRVNAHLAVVGLLTTMRLHVSLQASRRCAVVFTLQLAHERLLSSVTAHMDFQISSGGAGVVTDVAEVGFLSSSLFDGLLGSRSHCAKFLGFSLVDTSVEQRNFSLVKAFDEDLPLFCAPAASILQGYEITERNLQNDKITC